MQEQFTIKGNPYYDSTACTLAIRAGSHHFGYAVYHNTSRELIKLGWFRLQQLNLQPLRAIMQQNPVLSETFEKVNIGFDFNTYTLLPLQYSMGDHNALMYLEGANQQDHIIRESVSRWDISVSYTLPYEVLNWFVNHFPGASYWHVQTTSVTSLAEVPTGGILKVDFTDTHFNLVAAAGSKLLLAHSYCYKSPEDITFYLLKVCKAYGLQQEQVILEVSGLVEEQSKLYKELYDYFLHIQLRPAEWICNTSPHPAHYFTSLNQLALCESLQVS